MAITYSHGLIMEITGKLDEPNITFRDGIFLKNVSSALNKKSFSF